MSGSIVGTGLEYEDQARAGLENAANLEQRRNIQTRANRASRIQGEASLAGTGAAIGSYAGPWGAVIGGVVGLAAGYLM